MILAFVSFAVGNFSPTHKKFDFAMTVIMPAVFFCFLFIMGFLDKNNLETRFHLDRAFRVVSEPWWLITYGIMALTTFCASFKPIRILTILREKKLLTQSEGWTLKSQRKNRDFCVVSTGDSCFAPQILEVRYS